MRRDALLGLDDDDGPKLRPEPSWGSEVGHAARAQL